MSITDFRRSSALTILGTATNAGAIGGVTISSNGIAQAGWVLVATGSNSAIWRDAISFGSNTNDVSSVGTMGSSASNSRADHVHRGVRSISHTSNTFYGDITLTTPNDGVAITSPSAGTLAISKDWHRGDRLTGSHRVIDVSAPQTFAPGSIGQLDGRINVVPDLDGIVSQPTIYLHSTRYADATRAGAIDLSPITRVDIGGGVAITGDATSTVTGINSNLTLANTTSVLRWNGASAATFTGLTGGLDGRVVVLQNVTSGQVLTLAHDVTSTAANRFYCPAGIDLVLTPHSGVGLQYDSTSSRWRVLAPTPQDGSGSAFPTAPVANMRWFRTDLGGWYYYNGTRWLSEAPVIIDGGSAIGVAAGATVYYSAPPDATTTLWIEQVVFSSYVAATNNGSNYWTLGLYKYNSAAAATAVATRNTNADTQATFYSNEVAVGAVYDPAAHPVFGLTPTIAAGAPGTLNLGCTIVARKIAT